MFVILEYSDESFKRLEERAFINSRTIGEYIHKATEYPANDFCSWRVDNPTAEPELYISDKPYKSKRKKNKKRLVRV